MYGHIHCVVRDLVTSQFGQETWETILKEAGLDEREHFMLFYHYDDRMILDLVKAASKCLNLTVETVLEVFGDYFLIHCLRYGYDDMLRTLGSDITSFIQNLDSLHSLLALTYDKMVAPSFRCETNEDESLTLHYYSARTGLHPLVKGVLKAVAREIFDQEVEVTMLSENSEKLDEERVQNHVVFRVVIVRREQAEDQALNVKERGDDVQTVTYNSIAPVTLSKEQFVATFPYHLIFTEDLILHQFGYSLGKLSPVSLHEGMNMAHSFRILYPRMSFTVVNIKRFINAIFIIAVGNGSDKKEDNVFSMKGQMIWMQESKLMIFIGSPRLTSLKEMKRMNVYMADIPLYDVTREMILLYQQRNAEIDITKKLDETTAELRRTSRELDVEKQKTERLLYQMLPQKVANQLKNGQKVEAEKFDQVTILFSDIVTFTNIAAACSPLDIVNMLNDMYHRFDRKTIEHDVYKVETIGDAYMVVCGVPEKTTDHANPVANFALDMVEQAACVLSPATGKPLQIRIGIHTGPVVAGVVGLKMPRYCLFGDTVNTASRMESHGIPGRIHLSPTTYKALEGQGYLCKCRGETNIKGKGNMLTYFVIGNRDHTIFEPDDEYLNLPIIKQQGGTDELLSKTAKSKHFDRTSCTSDSTDSVFRYNTLLEDDKLGCDKNGESERKDEVNNEGDSDSLSDCSDINKGDIVSIEDIPVFNNNQDYSCVGESVVNQDECDVVGHVLKTDPQNDRNSQAAEKEVCPSYSKTCHIF